MNQSDKARLVADLVGRQPKRLLGVSKARLDGKPSGIGLHNLRDREQ